MREKIQVLEYKADVSFMRRYKLIPRLPDFIVTGHFNLIELAVGLKPCNQSKNGKLYCIVKSDAAKGCRKYSIVAKGGENVLDPYIIVE